MCLFYWTRTRWTMGKWLNEFIVYLFTLSAEKYQPESNGPIFYCRSHATRLEAWNKFDQLIEFRRCGKTTAACAIKVFWKKKTAMNGIEIGSELHTIRQQIYCIRNRTDFILCSLFFRLVIHLIHTKWLYVHEIDCKCSRTQRQLSRFILMHVQHSFKWNIFISQRN